MLSSHASIYEHSILTAYIILFGSNEIDVHMDDPNVLFGSIPLMISKSLQTGAISADSMGKKNIVERTGPDVVHRGNESAFQTSRCRA